MGRTISIGAQNFVTLITRPRRFGKTLTMSMLECFFSVKFADRGDLFEKLDIWKYGKYRELQGTYPVLFITFAGIKQDSYEKTRLSLNQLLANLYNDYRWLAETEWFSDADRAFFRSVGADMPDHVAAIWSLLTASGYLKILSFEDARIIGTRRPDYRINITNLEVLAMFEAMVSRWFDRSEGSYNQFLKALLLNDVRAMNRYMNRVAMRIFSYFDTGKQPSESEPERFYHGFVLGLMVDLQERYEIKSNRESGFGRYDVLMRPKRPEDYAYILEFKVREPEDEGSLEETVRAAHEQIERKQYAAELLGAGIPEERIRAYGFAFEGKNVLIG